MKPGKEEIQGLFRAVKIEGTPEEMERISEEIHAFEKWAEPLLSLNTGKTEPVFYNFRGVNVQREDRVTSGGDREKLFRTAFNFEDGFYRVPPIIE